MYVREEKLKILAKKWMAAIISATAHFPEFGVITLEVHQAEVQ